MNDENLYLHNEENNQDDDAGYEREESKEESLRGALAIDTPVSFGSVGVQSVVDVIRNGSELLVQPTLKDAVLLQLAD